MNVLRHITDICPQEPINAVRLVRRYLNEIILTGLYRSNFFGYAAL